MEAKSDELLQAILRDDISFYVIPRSQGELPVGLKAESIYREQLLLVAEGSMLTEDMFLDESSVLNMTEGKRKNWCVNLSKMANLPFIMLKKGHAIRKKTDLVLRQYGIDPKIMIELSSCISAVQLAAAGLGVAIVPQRAIDALGGMERFNCYDFYNGYSPVRSGSVYAAPLPASSGLLRKNEDMPHDFHWNPHITLSWKNQDQSRILLS
jgi:DNA-binding transcriptional LysR family regulator